MLYSFIDGLMRSPLEVDTARAEAVAPRLASRRFATGPDATPATLLNYGFSRAQIDLATRILRHSPSADIEIAQWRVLSLAHAARGAWDSALIAADRYAQMSAAPGEPALHALTLATIGFWLGAVDSSAVAMRRSALERREDDLPAELDAEVAWLDGMSAVARKNRGGIERAREAIASLEQTGRTRLLVRSLAAFELELGGRRGAAADSLVVIERHSADSGDVFGIFRYHPYLTSVNRLAAARWLVQDGRPAEANPLLFWHEPVHVLSAYRLANANAMMRGLAYLERARVEAAQGRQTQAREFYLRFLDAYDRPVAAHEWLRDEARAAVRAEPGR